MPAKRKFLMNPMLPRLLEMAASGSFGDVATMPSCIHHVVELPSHDGLSQRIYPVRMLLAEAASGRIRRRKAIGSLLTSLPPLTDR